MDLHLDSKVFIVTGGTSGLGYATAEALTRENALVLVSSRDPGKVAEAVTSLGGNARGLPCDLADPRTPAALFAAAADFAAERGATLGGVFVSVGGPAKGRFFETTEDDWRAAVDSVLLGTVRLARRAATELPEGGAIGMVLSSSVWNPIADIAISNALRPGLAMTIKTLADEVGPRGIRVFGVSPGVIRTPRLGNAEVPVDDIPLRRLGSPTEFGEVAAFLLSPRASYVTGCTIPIDGGSVRSI